MVRQELELAYHDFANKNFSLYIKTIVTKRKFEKNKIRYDRYLEERMTQT